MSLNAGEATVPGNARFNSELFWGSGAKLSIEQGGSLELGNSLAGSAIPFIDFHYGRGANQDFNVRSLRSNVVLRWEWRPGSALFLVWQQDQEADRPFGRVRPGDLWDALSTSGDSFFAVKISYWLPVR